MGLLRAFLFPFAVARGGDLAVYGGGGGSLRGGLSVQTGSGYQDAVAGAFVAGCAVPGVNGVYGPFLTGASIIEELPQLAELVGSAATRAYQHHSSGWLLALLLVAPGAAEKEWVLIDAEMQVRFYQEHNARRVAAPEWGPHWNECRRPLGPTPLGDGSNEGDGQPLVAQGSSAGNDHYKENLLSDKPFPYQVVGIKKTDRLDILREGQMRQDVETAEALELLHVLHGTLLHDGLQHNCTDLAKEAAEASTRKGEAHRAAGAHEHALVAAEAALALCPRSVSALVLRGMLHLDHGLPREALLPFQTAFVIEPSTGLFRWLLRAHVRARREALAPPPVVSEVPEPAVVNRAVHDAVLAAVTRALEAEDGCLSTRCSETAAIAAAHAATAAMNTLSGQPGSLQDETVPGAADSPSFVAARWTSGDHYRVLGVRCDVATEEMRSIYRALSLQVHPDKVGGSAAAFEAVADAFGCLSKPECRAAHDDGHDLKPEGSSSASSFADYIERRYFPERFDFEPFGNPFNKAPDKRAPYYHERGQQFQQQWRRPAPPTPQPPSSSSRIEPGPAKSEL